MVDTSKTYRIRTNIGNENDNDYLTVSADLFQEYDTFDVLSVAIKSKDAYQLYNSNYGVVVGRVLANNGFGIPNAKISIFISADLNNGEEIGSIYPFNSPVGKDKNGVRYNLLPNDRVDGCHQVVGTFPTKRYVLDNDVILEVFDNYYTYTTKTNNSGDYMICGVPVGNHTIHMDLDLSDCGILSQKPRDFVYKGYTIEQFESPTKFKGGTDYNNLSQIFTQDQIVNVSPFWGNSDLGETIGISRCDIDVNFKFEPTCVFMGSIVSDNASNGFSKKCIPTDAMGNMDELVTGKGKIEMIRKTPSGSVEEFSIKGNKLINENGVWCYQIPMNLDYMVTDEYGNMVPTDNPDKGIPTRASVRFRLSMEDSEENTDNFFRAKVLVPNNPKDSKEFDYEFGTYTKDTSFRDLFWNNVYSVKSFIPRIQRHKNYRKDKFSGIKHCNKFGPNNPMPYNNIRIKMPLMFTIMCTLIKAYIFIISMINTVTVWIFRVLAAIANLGISIFNLDDLRANVARLMCKLRLITLKDGLCPDLENWYFAPSFNNINAYVYSGWTKQGEVKKAFKEESEMNKGGLRFFKNCDVNNFPSNCNEIQYQEIDENDGWTLSWEENILERTIYSIENDEIEEDDEKSIDSENVENSDEDEIRCLTRKTDYLIACIEMNLAQEYNVINFDFYNDWINGVIYNPRWVRFLKKKTRFLWITWAKEKIKGCMDDTSIFKKQRYYVQQCAVGYKENDVNGYKVITKIESPINTKDDDKIKNYEDANIAVFPKIVKSNNFHKKRGFKLSYVFGKNGGICHEATTLKGQRVYYLRPCEYNGQIKTNLYSNDIILLGTFNDCDLNGIPRTFTHLTSTSYVMPTNLALTNMDTNGPLYAKDGETICMGSGNGIKEESGVTEVDQTSRNKKGPLKTELEYYVNSGNYNINPNEIFGSGTFVDEDTIALTEAAGISWNYTGPGQGTIVKKKMYYPGGHFLGMSCVNSQTNIKSCINLSRICEIGTNLSQRRENVRGIDGGGLKYTYTVPTGFISGDDIVDTDFRSMFATLNKKRLIATKRNKKTGYKFYDFEFVNPINFDGSFSDIVYGDYLSDKDLEKDKKPYNEVINVIEENLSGFGITLGSIRGGDYDPEEPENTQTRTREITSLDYYLFRLGLEYEDLATVENASSKFLFKELDDKKKGTEYTYYLPQYENSFYFYFGLRDGATALDEFNKQFYSECDEIRIKTAPNIILASTINFCKANGDIHIITEGLSAPYQSVKIENKENGDVWEICVGCEGVTNEQLAILSKESFYFPKTDGEPEEFEFGEYVVTVIDDDDVEISKNILIGRDLFKYDLSIVNFNIPVHGEFISERNIYQGGFSIIENFECLYDGEENIDFHFELFKGESSTEKYEYIDDLGYVSYGIEAYVDYDLYVVWQCDDGEQQKLKLETVIFSDNKDIDLRLGYKDIYSISCLNEESDFCVLKYSSEDFWFGTSFDIGDENGDEDEKILKWFFRKMFFKESNLSTFDSHVYASDGCKKILWGAPQSDPSTMVNVGGYGHIYCSDRYLEIPNGTFLDDTKTITPTYGYNECYVQNNGVLRSVGENNCTFQYCAQSYRNSDVGGRYHGIYNRSTGLEITEENYFHEGYGCVFKPLPYGSLIFFEYSSDINSMKSYIDDKTSANYGIIYPTFIYPVMKRPFFGNFSMQLYNNIEVNVNNESGDVTYSFSTGDYRNNALLGIHNGITYDKHFSTIQMFSYDFGEEEVELPDTYDITLSSNTDRVYECSLYDEQPFYLNSSVFYKNVNFSVMEGFPINALYEYSGLAKTIFIDKNYDFYDNLYYRVSGDTEIGGEKIYAVFGEGTSESGNNYYIGYYPKEGSNIEFLIEQSNDVEKKYAYKRISDSYYIVLCRFNKDERIHESKWYTNVYVKIGFSLASSEVLHIKYEYMDTYGVESVYDNYVILVLDEWENLSTTYPNGINELLGYITDGYKFEREILEQGIAVQETLPFTPVMNYRVRNGNVENGQEYIDSLGNHYPGPNFKQFMQKLISKGYLRPIDSCETLPIQEVDGKYIFGIGVKNILSNEDNEVMSYVYKVYPSPFRDRYFSDTGDYSLIIEPEFYSYYGNVYKFGKGETYKDVLIDIVGQNHPCIILITLEGNGDWCYFNYANVSYYDSKEINYIGNPINIKLVIHSNNNQNDRECTLRIQSYYGGLRDSVGICIKQVGRLHSPNMTIDVLQTLPQQISEEEFETHQSYTYRLKISPHYEEPDLHNNYVKMKPNGFGAYRDVPYVPIFNNDDYIPNEILLDPYSTYDKIITVNDVNDIRYHVPFEMYESSTEVLDVDSDYNVTEIRYEFFT